MIVLVNKKRFTVILSVLLLLLLTVAGIVNIRNVKHAVYPTKYSRFVEKYAEEYGVDKYLIYSVIKAESNFDEKAVSEKGAMGLMQIMPATAREAAGKLGMEGFDVQELLVPEINIQIGCYYMAFLLERYMGDVTSAAAAYNAGYGNVDNWLAMEQTERVTAEVVPFGETKKYIVKVENNYSKYKELYEKGMK